MGYCSHFFQMIMFRVMMVLVILSLLSNANIVIASNDADADAAALDDDAAEGFRVHGLKMEESSDFDLYKIDKVSGEDEDGENEPLIVQKFRVLLGFNSKRRKKDESQDVYSPSPSPLPSIEPETPSPTPWMQIHSHSHPNPPRRTHNKPRHHQPAHHKVQKTNKDNERFRRVLVPVFVSAGAAAFVVCVLGLICACGKIKKQENKSEKTMWVDNSKKSKSKFMGSQNLTSKASLNPTMDLFYLNSSGMDLEQQQHQHQNDSSSDYNLHERKESESDNANSSSTKEIMSVHDDGVSVRCETDGENSPSAKEIRPIGFHSSEGESFHSFGDSNSSVVRLSNASACSLGDKAENCISSFPKVLSSRMSCTTPDDVSTMSPRSKTKHHHDKKTAMSCSSVENFMPPPPPPPLAPRSVMVSSTSQPSLSSPINLKPLSSCIPPPPYPPPPFPDRNSKKGPPPPPCQLSPYTPLGKDGVPLPKLKPLHWDKVRATPDRSMVWDKLKPSSFELDEEMIGSLFSYNLHSSVKNDESKSKTPSPSKHILDPKRLQNITILSKALNVTAEQVCDALMRGNGLSSQQLEALVKMVPTKEEETKLSNFKGNINELGSVEKFVKAILSIPFAFLRVEAMLYRETFEDEVVHLRNSFSMLEEACKELRSSRLFLKLLEAVLKTGNRMNVGTIRGGARAFKLDTLLKLSDVKGADGKTTLLHFVVQEIIRSEGIKVSDSIMGKISQRNKTLTAEEKEEDYRKMGLDLVSGLTTELYNVKKTATIDLDVLASSVSNLSDGKAKLQHLVREKLSTDSRSISFVQSMNSFLIYSEKNIKELQEDENRVLLHVKEITEYFHGNLGKDEANPLRIFMIVRDFLGMLDHVCKELRNSKIASCPNPLAPFR